MADELPILRFIPFRRAEVLAMCLSEKRLAPVQEEQFRNACEILENHFRQDFSRIWQCKLDFEIDDALAKLLRLGLVQRDGERWQPG